MLMMWMNNHVEVVVYFLWYVRGSLNNHVEVVVKVCVQKFFVVGEV